MALDAIQPAFNTGHPFVDAIDLPALDCDLRLQMTHLRHDMP